MDIRGLKRVIWKFTLEPKNLDDGVFEVDLSVPEGARPLHVGFQKGSMCLWALVDPGADKAPARLMIYGTGRSVDDEHLLHLGTIISSDHALVWHVFLDISKGRVLALGDA